MKAVRFAWKALGVLAVINFAYYGAMFAGAWLSINAVPEPPVSTQALAFIGAALTMCNLVFPQSQT